MLDPAAAVVEELIDDPQLGEGPAEGRRLVVEEDRAVPRDQAFDPPTADEVTQGRCQGRSRQPVAEGVDVGSEFPRPIHGLTKGLEVRVGGDDEQPGVVAESVHEIEEEPFSAADRKEGQQKEHRREAVNGWQIAEGLVHRETGLLDDGDLGGVGSKAVGSGGGVVIEGFESGAVFARGDVRNDASDHRCAAAVGPVGSAQQEVSRQCRLRVTSDDPRWTEWAGGRRSPTSGDPIQVLGDGGHEHGLEVNRREPVEILAVSQIACSVAFPVIGGQRILGLNKAGGTVADLCQSDGGVVDGGRWGGGRQRVDAGADRVVAPVTRAMPCKRELSLDSPQPTPKRWVEIPEEPLEALTDGLAGHLRAHRGMPGRTRRRRS